MDTNTYFLLQNSGQPAIFSYETVAAIDSILYNQWSSGREIGFSVVTDEDMLNFDPEPDLFYVPVGSVKFVEHALASIYGVTSPPPLNIPTELQKPEFLSRRVVSSVPCSQISSVFDMWSQQSLFVKPADKTKQFEARIVYRKDIERLTREIGPDTNLFVSERVDDIGAEWRVFVYRGRIVDVRPYDLTQGWLAPDRCVVQTMINTWGDKAPAAYTLDVGVQKNYVRTPDAKVAKLVSGKTFLIEAHRFYACGLYGADMPELAAMLAATIKELVYLRKE